MSKIVTDWDNIKWTRALDKLNIKQMRSLVCHLFGKCGIDDKSFILLIKKYVDEEGYWNE